MTKEHIALLCFLLLLAGSILCSLFSWDMFWILAFLSMLPLSLRLGCEAGKPLDMFAPEAIFPISYIVFLTLGGLNLSLETEFGMQLPSTIWPLYIAGLLAYLAGTQFMRALTPPMKSSAKGERIAFWPIERFPMAIGLLLVIGLGAKLIGLARFGIGIATADQPQTRVASSGGLLGVLSLSAEVAAVALFAYLLIQKPRGMVRTATVALIAAIVLIQATGVNRTGLLRVFLPSLLVFHYASRRISAIKLALAGVLIFVFAAALGTFRDVSETGDARIRSLEEMGFSSQTYWLMNGYELLRLPAEDLQMVRKVVPAFESYTWGATSTAAIWQVLPGHRPGPSEILKVKILRMDFVGFGAACTILGALWVDGGYVGVAIGMFLLGTGVRMAYWLLRRNRNVFWLLIYAWQLPNQLHAIKDDILSDLGPMYMFTLIVLMHAICVFVWSPRVSTAEKA